MSGTFQTAQLTGTVVSTSIAPTVGVVADVQSADGTIRSVVFGGRNPNDKLPDGSENTFTEAWVGDLPQPGQQYTITGTEFDGPDGPIYLSECAETASLVLIASSPAITNETGTPAPLDEGATTTAVTSESLSSDDSGSSWAVVVVLVVVATAIGGGVLLARRRVSRSGP